MTSPTNGRLVSVVVPTYQRPQLLPRAIGSILDQTYRPIEVIVVNDGSRDETDTVIDGLKVDADSRGLSLVPLSKSNGGVSSARNAGLKRVAGDFVAFLDDDDYWYPEKLSKQMQAIAESGVSACCCLTDCTTEQGPATHPRTPAQLLRGAAGPSFVAGKSYAWINSIVVRRDVVERTGDFDSRLPHGEDDEWIARLCFEAQFCAVEEALCRWSYTPVSLTRLSGIEQLIKRDDDYRLMLRTIRDSCKDRPGWEEQAWRGRVARDFDQFMKHRLYAGDLAGARSVLVEAYELVGAAAVRRSRAKYRKAWLLSWFGMRLPHPKHDDLTEIRR